MDIKMKDVAKILNINYTALMYRAQKGFLPWVLVTKLGENSNHYEIVPAKFREYYGDEIYNKVFNHA